MKHEARKRSRKSGLPPGTLVFTGERHMEKPRLMVIDFDDEHVVEKELSSLDECLPFKDRPTVTWLNVDGLHDTELLQRIGDAFSIHPLVMEDILNTDQRPKVEFFDTYAFIVVRMLYAGEKPGETVSEQLSIILSDSFVISFQEKIGDIFGPVRERIRGGKGRIRKMGSDYLAYSLVDAVVDSYFSILETFGEKIEDLEDDLISTPDSKSLQQIHELKRTLIGLRRSTWPLREVVGAMQREESTLFQKPTLIYLRDVYDHVIQIVDTVESYRDTVTGMVGLYMSSASNRMNEVMKVLTIIATIFIPLTFIVGVYGMNFNPHISPFNMPELNWYWGYPVVLGVMLLIAALMVIYFRRKKWL